MIISSKAGTTLDFIKKGQHYYVIDTAGVKQKDRVKQAIEKFSVLKSLGAIEQCNVVVLVLLNRLWLLLYQFAKHTYHYLCRSSKKKIYLSYRPDAGANFTVKRN